MKTRLTICWLLTAGVLLIASVANADEAHTQSIISSIENTRQDILAKAGNS